VNGGTMSEEEGAGGAVVKLLTIVALDCLNHGAKLSSHISKKVRESRKCV
jgi:hypothetical protein